jgi:type I restriction enzyme S subunit
MQTVAGVGGSLLRARPDGVGEIQAPLPPLDEQRRIAAILDQADALRRKRRETLDTVDGLGHSIFDEMFGASRSKDSDIPADVLGNHLLFVTSGGRNWAKFYSPNGARFLRSLDIQVNSIGNEDVVFVRAPSNAEAQRTRVQAGDVLLTITGSRIGRVAAVPDHLAGSYVSQHVAILRPDAKTILPHYLSFFLNQKNGGQLQISKAQYGQTKPGLNFEQIKRFQLPIPAIKLQREFLDRVNAIEAIRTAQFAHLMELDALFASLQNRAFRGEL